LVFAIGLGLGGHWWTHPTVFSSGDSGSIELNTSPLQDFPVHIGFATSHHGDPETITLHRAEVTMDSNMAQFAVELRVCTERPVKEGSLKLGTGMRDEDLGELCTRLRPVRDGTKMRLAEEQTDYLIASLTPKRAGSGHFGRVKLTYSRDGRHLLQRGSQTLTEDVTLSVR
jgi:hypothetical protein